MNERGVGRALKYCIPQFRYPYVLSLDVDLSSDLSFISDTLTHLNGYDIVIGSKKLGLKTVRLSGDLGVVYISL